MTDSFRLTVLKALTAALEQITEANGYQHTMTGAVFRGRIRLDETDPWPALTINEPPQLAESLPAPETASSRTVLTLLIQGFVKDDPAHPTDPAYLLLADVQKRLAQEKIRDDGFDILGFGERVLSLLIGQGVVRPPDELVSPSSYFWLPITLTFAERLDDPFA